MAAVATHTLHHRSQGLDSCDVHELRANHSCIATPHRAHMYCLSAARCRALSFIHDPPLRLTLALRHAQTFL